MQEKKNVPATGPGNIFFFFIRTKSHIKNGSWQWLIKFPTDANMDKKDFTKLSGVNTCQYNCSDIILEDSPYPLTGTW